jgi:hypothetical protein
MIEFINVFKLQSAKDAYSRYSFIHTKEHWGDVLTYGSGFIDSTMTISKNGELVPPFQHLASKKLKIYMNEKVGDFNLYSRHFHSKSSSYEIDIRYNISSLGDEFWGDLRLSLDEHFSLTNATFSYDTRESHHEKLNYWINMYTK